MKPETDAVDLTAFLPTEASILEMLSPAGAKTGWKITLNGPSDPKAVAWVNDDARRKLHKAKLIEQAQVNGKKYSAEEKTPDEARAENIAWVISRISDWTPVKIGGEVYAFNDDSAGKLLIKPEMGWALQQIIDALNDERRFTPRSAKA